MDSLALHMEREQQKGMDQEEIPYWKGEQQEEMHGACTALVGGNGA